MNNQINDGGSAMPHHAMVDRDGDMISGPDAGITMRQYYAAMAMQGLMASSASYDPEGVAIDSFRVADAMIAHEHKEKPTP